MSYPAEIGTYAERNSLQEFRDRTWMLLGWATVPFLLPFSINSFIQGRNTLGLLTMSVVLLGVINSLYIKKNHRPLIPYWAFYIVQLCALTYAIPILGVVALFWCYPSLFVVSFIVERSQAKLLIMIAFVILLPLIFYYEHFYIAVRFGLTLAMTCYFSHLLVGYMIKVHSNMVDLTIRDPLTGAFNRRHMDTCLLEAIEEKKRGFGPVSILLIDFDHFKMINDTLGHEAGDDVLKSIVNTIKQHQRRLDYLFRIGGEEFVILLRNTTLDSAVTVAENLRKQIEQIELLENRKVTISLGVAEYQNDESIDQWLSRADEHLYKAKDMGRNRTFPEAAS